MNFKTRNSIYRIISVLTLSLLFTACTQNESIEEGSEEPTLTIDNSIALEFQRRGIAQKQVPPYPYRKQEGSDQIISYRDNNSETEEAWQTFEEEYGSVNYDNLFVIDSTNTNTVFPLLNDDNLVIGWLTGHYNADGNIRYWVKPIESDFVLESGDQLTFIKGNSSETSESRQTSSAADKDSTVSNRGGVCVPIRGGEFCVGLYGEADSYTDDDLTCFTTVTGWDCEDDNAEEQIAQDDGSGGGDPDEGGGGWTPVTTCSSGFILDPTTDTCMEEIIDFSVDKTNTTKIDPQEELKCFDRTTSAKLIVYVQQPRENSDAVIGPNQVGHAFIGLEQGDIVRQLGFYPDSNASSGLVAVGVEYDSELRDNYNYLYHVSISKNISSTQLTSIINYIENYPDKYDVNEYACVDFAITVGNMGGLGLPSTTVSHITFSGRSPGKLGQEIREMESNNTTTISTNSSSKQGRCN